MLAATHSNNTARLEHVLQLRKRDAAWSCDLNTPIFKMLEVSRREFVRVLQLDKLRPEIVNLLLAAKADPTAGGKSSFEWTRLDAVSSIALVLTFLPLYDC